MFLYVYALITRDMQPSTFAIVSALINAILNRKVGLMMSRWFAGFQELPVSISADA